jgi:hypothetical protein
MEYWSDGVMLKKIGSEYSNIPTPILQLARYLMAIFFEPLNMTGS